MSDPASPFHEVIDAGRIEEIAGKLGELTRLLSSSLPAASVDLPGPLGGWTPPEPQAARASG